MTRRTFVAEDSAIEQVLTMVREMKRLAEVTPEGVSRGPTSPPTSTAVAGSLASGSRTYSTPSRLTRREGGRGWNFPWGNSPLTQSPRARRLHLTL